MRKVKDAVDLTTNEKIYFKGHAKATYLSDGRNVEEALGEPTITVDSALSDTSENPVQNKVITEELNKKANAIAIPTKTSQLTNDSDFVKSSTLQENYQPKGNYLTEIPSNYITDEEVDDELSDTSGNPVQNKVITAKFTEISEEIKDKQSTISDLDTIRSGAGKGATAVQPSTLTNYATIEFVNNAIQTAIINELNSDF